LLRSRVRGVMTKKRKREPGWARSGPRYGTSQAQKEKKERRRESGRRGVLGPGIRPCLREEERKGEKKRRRRRPTHTEGDKGRKKRKIAGKKEAELT